MICSQWKMANYALYFTYGYRKKQFLQLQVSTDVPLAMSTLIAVHQRTKAV